MKILRNLWENLWVLLFLVCLTIACATLWCGVKLHELISGKRRSSCLPDSEA